MSFPPPPMKRWGPGGSIRCTPGVPHPVPRGSTGDFGVPLCWGGHTRRWPPPACTTLVTSFVSPQKAGSCAPPVTHPPLPGTLRHPNRCGGGRHRNRWGVGAVPAVLRDTDGGGSGTSRDNGGWSLSHRFAPEPPGSHRAHPRGLRPAVSPGAPGQRERGAGTERGCSITPVHQGKDETSTSHPKNTGEGAGMPVLGGATVQPPPSRSGVRGLKLPELNRWRGRPAEKSRRLHRPSV